MNETSLFSKLYDLNAWLLRSQKSTGPSTYTDCDHMYLILRDGPEFELIVPLFRLMPRKSPNLGTEKETPIVQVDTFILNLSNLK